MIFLILSFFLLHAPPSSSATATGPDFILESCNATLYPDLCYRSLARYASTVHHDPAKLATTAITMSLSRARHAAAYFSNLTGACDPRAAAAVRDCSSTFSDTVSEMRDSRDQMQRLPPRASAGAFRFQLSNVQTWMSAALTYEDTCTDGFDGVQPDLPVKTDVCDRANKVMKSTSIALALVNRFATSYA